MLSSTSALIQWEPVECLEQNGEIRNYQVVIQAVDMPPVVLFSEGTSVTVTELFPGVEYIVRVSGTNVGGGGPSSEFVSFMLIGTHSLRESSNSGSTHFWSQPSYNPPIESIRVIIRVTIRGGHLHCCFNPLLKIDLWKFVANI